MRLFRAFRFRVRPRDLLLLLLFVHLDGWLKPYLPDLERWYIAGVRIEPRSFELPTGICEEIGLPERPNGPYYPKSRFAHNPRSPFQSFQSFQIEPRIHTYSCLRYLLISSTIQIFIFFISNLKTESRGNELRVGLQNGLHAAHIQYFNGVFFNEGKYIYFLYFIPAV